MNLIVGATGLLGGEICRKLRAANKPVRALVRPTADKAKVENLKTLGVELVSGDLKDRASLDRACQGVRAVISSANSVLSRQAGDSIQTVDLEGQKNLIDAASAAGVGHFIFVSLSSNLDIDCPLTRAKRAVEEHLKQSGLGFTILRPAAFMEIWLSPAVGFDFPNAKARVFGSGEGKISFISFPDAAQFAAFALDHSKAKNATIELGGPEALSHLEVIAVFEELIGRKFEIEKVPEEALWAQKQASTDPLQESFAALMLGMAKGDAIDMRETLRRLPVQLCSVRDYARRVAAV
ncbi:SDR family oxidoreductase [candidate division KSB1 bacterium]|nr:MAG: SDR family oxidoreductase [candidate division KSB1 bacterium]MBC6946636.1 SDR family NAD(P)-dependent oxidoreductase [candidate division KSB1 bacterium]MCE7940632.1 SDR family oxidoreductase [Chlorobi bacterium CHB1]MDL1873602.1 SDR family oxidoreductase [Cytophagia bacterium CHB2]